MKRFAFSRSRRSPARLAAWVALPIVLSAIGCELITSPDRTLIPDGSGAAGSGASAGSGAASGSGPASGAGAGGAQGGDSGEGGGGQSAGSAGEAAGGQSMGGAGGDSVGGDSGAGGMLPMAGAGGEAGGAGGAGGEPGGPSVPIGKVIYLTGTPKKANFGGVSSADQECNASPPFAGTYKALLVDGTTRVACTSAACATNGAAEGVDWALAPSTQYVRADGTTVIGTTNAAAVFAFPLSNSLGTSGISYWTGLASDWTTSADNCTGWTATSGVFATEGLADQVDDQSLDGVSESCASLAGAFFACVQQ